MTAASRERERISRYLKDMAAALPEGDRGAVVLRLAAALVAKLRDLRSHGGGR